MRAVTLIISSREETNRRFRQAFEGKPQGTFISFESPALLFKVLTGVVFHIVLSKIGGSVSQSLRHWPWSSALFGLPSLTQLRDIRAHT